MVDSSSAPASTNHHQLIGCVSITHSICSYIVCDIFNMNRSAQIRIHCLLSQPLNGYFYICTKSLHQKVNDGNWCIANSTFCLCVCVCIHKIKIYSKSRALFREKRQLFGIWYMIYSAKNQKP